jgi:hypothetical protein
MVRLTCDQPDEADQDDPHQTAADLEDRAVERAYFAAQPPDISIDPSEAGVHSLTEIVEACVDVPLEIVQA